MRSGSRRSFRHAASRDAMPSRLSTPRSSSTPTSDDSIPPSNATLTFLRATAGSSKGRSVSCSMMGVALLDRSRETASTTESCDESRLSATSVAQNIGASRIGTARQAINDELKAPNLAEERFQFDWEEFSSQVAYRSVELDN